jgi:hypothetical protein
MKYFIVLLTLVSLSACGKQILTGPAGAPGATGATGATGQTGAPGGNCTVTAVASGVADPNGASLIQCPDGSQSLVLNGTDGTDGTNGTNGATGATGQTGATGATGAAGTNGTNGATGATGQTGATGTNGTNGTNGTVITPVQFCTGDTGSYPSTFPEVGFCINNNLYAVYSANGGFLTEVLPGTWSSDGINASCTFTVAADCKVTTN